MTLKTITRNANPKPAEKTSPPSAPVYQATSETQSPIQKIKFIPIVQISQVATILDFSSL